MRRPVLILCLLLLAAAGAARAQQPAVVNAPAPELRRVSRWLNSEPLTLARLKGRVVILHFWTFG